MVPWELCTVGAAAAVRPTRPRSVRGTIIGMKVDLSCGFKNQEKRNDSTTEEAKGCLMEGFTRMVL
jgi:hypothetical protein